MCWKLIQQSICILFSALALCDWSDLQKTRRRIARFYCSPRFASPQFGQLSSVAAQETQRLLERIRSNGDAALRVKPLIQATCANMFANYMCSTSFDYDDAQFKELVQNFDEIFWDINQGYAVDFLPWLLPAYQVKNFILYIPFLHEVT
jgi:cytochrome P450 family 307 subfamily A